jgi:hypothetical protein
MSAYLVSHGYYSLQLVELLCPFPSSLSLSTFISEYNVVSVAEFMSQFPETGLEPANSGHREPGAETPPWEPCCSTPSPFYHFAGLYESLELTICSLSDREKNGFSRLLFDYL